MSESEPTSPAQQASNPPTKLVPIEHNCASAQDFLNQLTDLSRDGFKYPEYRSPWVFRGHNDANWELKPSAWREDGQKKLRIIIEWGINKIKEIIPYQYKAKKIVDSHGEIDWGDPSIISLLEFHSQTIAEVVAVKHFCDKADDLGLSIPMADEIIDEKNILDAVVIGYVTNSTYSVGIIEHIDIFGRIYYALFPDIPFAFAQHHGIPTRYLDWTQEPLIAAFFAAAGAAELVNPSSDKLCVWATKMVKQDPNTKWVTVPRSQHHYLHAQHGLFSVCKDASTLYHAKNHWPSFEEWAGKGVSSVNLPVLHKFMLPITEAAKLQVELLHKKISRAHLMPTLDNVAIDAMTDWKLQ